MSIPRRKILWGLSLLSLIAGPVAIVVVGTVWGRVHPVRSEPPFDEPLPLAYRAVEWLTALHLVAWAIASLAVSWLTRGRRRYLAWVALLAWLALALAVSFDAMMATTGIYL